MGSQEVGRLLRGPLEYSVEGILNQFRGQVPVDTGYTQSRANQTFKAKRGRATVSIGYRGPYEESGPSDRRTPITAAYVRENDPSSAVLGPIFDRNVNEIADRFSDRALDEILGQFGRAVKRHGGRNMKLYK